MRHSPDALTRLDIIYESYDGGISGFCTGRELQPVAFEGATARAHNVEYTRYNDALFVALSRPTLRALTGPPTWPSEEFAYGNSLYA